MDNSPTLNKNGTDAARSGLLRLHDAVCRRELGRPEAALSPDELLARFRAADPSRNAVCLPWLLRTYAAGGYRLEDLSKAHDTLAAFARLRGLLPNMATIDGETRNPRKLGSHLTLASLWSVIAPFVEAERLAQQDCSGEHADTDKERALSHSRVIHRSARMVIAVPMTEEASCWWGQGTQWCTAARKNNAFEQYYKKAPLIVVCLRKVGDLPARKLQLYVHAGDMQFMDQNDAEVSPELVSERWQDLEALLHWTVGGYGWGLRYIPAALRTEAMCTAAVGRDAMAFIFVPDHLRTEAICLAAVGRNGDALQYVPEPLRTEAICTAAVSSNGWALEYVPEPLCTEAMCTAAVTEHGWALKDVPEPLRTEALCLTAVGSYGRALEYIPESLRTEAMCWAAVGKDGWALKHVPEPLRTEALCLAAVTQYGRALEYVPEHLRKEALCLTAVEKDGDALYYISEPMRTEAICTAAVGSNGRALRYIPESLRTEAMCWAAVGKDGWALKFVPEPLRTETVCLAAVGRYGGALADVPEHLRTEVMRLIAVGSDKQKSLSTTIKTNERESHDLVLEGLKDYLNNSQPNHRNMTSTFNLSTHQ